MLPTKTNPDFHAQLLALQEAGLDVMVGDSTLRVGPIQTRTSERGTTSGELVVLLTRVGDTFGPGPSDHRAWWVSDDVPRNVSGEPLEKMICDPNPSICSDDIESRCCLSWKREHRPYRTYQEQIETYRDRLEKEAQVHRLQRQGIFNHQSRSRLRDANTRATRSGIGHVEAKYRSEKVSIVGCGGTGGYVLDLVAKCDVEEIRIYDPDVIDANTAGRWPGVVEEQAILLGQNKADFLASVYNARVHKNVSGFPQEFTERDVTRLGQYDTVFICIDDGEKRHKLAQALAAQAIRFLDCGIDLHEVEGRLWGSVRVTNWYPKDDVALLNIPARNREEAEYGRNLQIAELNSLNASLAVITWKQQIDVYRNTYGWQCTKFHTETHSVSRLRARHNEVDA